MTWPLTVRSIITPGRGPGYRPDLQPGAVLDDDHVVLIAEHLRPRLVLGYS